MAGMVLLLKRKLFVSLVALGCVVVVAILYFTYRNTQELVAASAWIEHTHDVLLESDQVAMDVKDIQVNGRVYLVTKDTSFLATIAADEKSAAIHIEKLRQLVSDNPRQVLETDSLNILWKGHTSVAALRSAAAEGDVTDGPKLRLFVESKIYEDVFNRAIEAFQDEERALLIVRKAKGDEKVQSFGWFLAGLVLALIALTVLILVSVRRGEKLKEEITERNLSLEKTLREVSDYKYALDESAIVAITDQRGVIKHVNDNFCKISKYSREELIGKDHRIVNSGYHSKEFMRNIWQTISRGEVWKGELKNKAKDGTIYWVYTSIVPFVNEQGRPQQYLAIRSDITERKINEEVLAANMRLEREVRDKKAELGDILEMMTDAFATLDNNLCYRYVNKKFTELAQKDGEKIIGKYIWDEFPEAVGSATYHAINTAMKERRYIRHMDAYQPLDVYYENHIYPTAHGLSVLIHDVSGHMKAEKKLAESERLYRTVVSSIPDSAILLLDNEYRYFLIEGDLLEKVGYKREELLGGKASEVLPKERFQAFEPAFKRVFNGETFSMELNRAGVDLMVKYVPLRNEKNEVYAAMIVSMDITEMKTAQRKVADLNASLETKIVERTSQLELANKDLESFSYSVAHDLRAPLRGVAGYSTMLAEDYRDKLDDEGKRLIGEINYNAAKMGTLIDDVLTFSKLGRKEIRRSVVDMNLLIDDVLKDLPENNAKISLNDINPLYGDFTLLKHVVFNLVSNAVKYSSRKQNPTIRISSAEKKGMMVYSIADNGVGFDMQYAEKLFGVFQRLHSSEEFEGTGVGLAIVKRIVNRHGGDVWVEAKQDHGATFYFSVPLKPAA